MHGQPHISEYLSLIFFFKIIANLASLRIKSKETRNEYLNLLRNIPQETVPCKWDKCRR